MLASSPGKIIIFGEHAVVYGRHAVVTAINLRTFALVEKYREFVISSPLGTSGLDMDIHPYITSAIEKLKPFGVEGCRIEIRSDIPIASGLGSSSAVTVSVIAGINSEFELGLKLDEIYEIARQVEKDVQGIASGTDPFISTFGGCYLIPERKKINVGDIYFAVLNTGEKSITREMVNKVAKLRDEYPEIVEKIFDAIDAISLMAVDSLEKGRKREIGVLMEINQHLLAGLGVSSPGIERALGILRDAGLPGKLTGAGGGGSVIAVLDRESMEELRKEIPQVKIVRSEMEGVKIHD